MESHLLDCKEREVLEQEHEKNGDVVKVLELEQVQKMKHFSIAVLVEGNGYFFVTLFVAQRWGSVSRLSWKFFAKIKGTLQSYLYSLPF